MDFPRGFGINGIKPEKGENLGLIYAPEGMITGGVFTTNKNAAHPVNYCRKYINKSNHKAILVNKGRANAATGKKGKLQLQELVDKASLGLNCKKEELLVASTGSIGKIPIINDDKLNLLISRKERVKPYEFAEAIMTTDTQVKVLSSDFTINGKDIRLAAVAKGSGMVNPDLATMLVFICTDLNIKKEYLTRGLKEVNRLTFNNLNIDGETSTNDSVFISSTRKATNRRIESESGNYKKFLRHLKKLCTATVEKIAADGEGATKLIKIHIKGALTDKEAQKGAQGIAASPLCKTAFYGASPNWGRIISVLGEKGIEVNTENFNIYVNGVHWIKDGEIFEKTFEQIKDILSGSKFKLTVDLGKKNGKATAYTCDLSPEYVRINAHYLT
ncbi:MAG: bifunctional glutamate N-acetyltransferase/amino-acid acetyltransferase ArgJ [Elusimicrobiota bacterium]